MRFLRIIKTTNKTTNRAITPVADKTTNTGTEVKLNQPDPDEDDESDNVEPSGEEMLTREVDND